ncbi:hypothetical protein ACLOJK_015268 [Asimina triloba]
MLLLSEKGEEWFSLGTPAQQQQEQLLWLTVLVHLLRQHMGESNFWLAEIIKASDGRKRTGAHQHESALLNSSSGRIDEPVVFPLSNS